MKMRIRFISGAAAALAGIAAITLAVARPADEDAREHRAFAAARVSISEAVAVAEAKTGARAMSAEFENEEGKFVYEIELLTGNGVELEALVDATSGALLSVDREDTAADNDDDDDDEDDDEDEKSDGEQEG